MSQDSPFHADSDAISEDRIHDLLKPLQDVNATVDYLNQYKAMKTFSQRLQNLELLFGDVYGKISTLENEIAKQKEKAHSSRP